jgi:hypothetical protein
MGGNTWSRAVLKHRSEGRPRVCMYDSYCFRCGVYTAIDQLTKMCRPCFDHWRAGPRPTPKAGPGR